MWASLIWRLNFNPQWSCYGQTFLRRIWETVLALKFRPCFLFPWKSFPPGIHSALFCSWFFCMFPPTCNLLSTSHLLCGHFRLRCSCTSGFAHFSVSPGLLWSGFLCLHVTVSLLGTHARELNIWGVLLNKGVRLCLPTCDIKLPCSLYLFSRTSIRHTQSLSRVLFPYRLHLPHVLLLPFPGTVKFPLPHSWSPGFQFGPPAIILMTPIVSLPC